MMMPQQANVFHQTVLEKTAQRWKPSGQERGHSLQQQFRPKTVYLGHMAEGIRCQESVLSNTQRTCFSFFPLPVRWPALGSFEVALQQLNGSITCWVWWMEATLKQNGQKLPDSLFREPVADVIEVGRVRMG